ncbi:unnamed protein product, partial [Musa acuminata var. zebrina]
RREAKEAAIGCGFASSSSSIFYLREMRYLMLVITLTLFGVEVVIGKRGSVSSWRTRVQEKAS